jgi:signal transduction histidine kinase
MDTLINDLLMLAREGKQISGLEAVDLATLTKNCWRNVKSTEATVRIDAERTIWADQRRLQQLVENLMRNAIEHGGQDVMVTIGELDNGFYI